MKVILCGYHWTGCEALRLLRNQGHEVFVFTHEGPYFVPSLIDFCRRTETPFSLENVSKATLPFLPDLIASVYYRNIIKRNVIDACEGRIFNLHPSLLPLYRGCSSLTWAMIEGQPTAGFTYHYIDEGCDTGNIILQDRISIHDFDSQATLFQRVAFKAMERFLDAVQLVSEGAKGKPQSGRSSYFPRGCPHDGIIDSNWPREQIATFIRAMINPPYPGAKFEGQEVLTLEQFDQLSKKTSTAA
jgi:methionyl-tRNA formyltransferase